MSDTLPFFWELASLDVEKRESSAKSLIAELNARQRAHEAEHAAEWSQWLAQTDTAERLEMLCAKDVHYALQRLIRGLPSPRQGARQGFALALTEEERDMLFGRIFGFMSIVRSTAPARATTTADDLLLIVSHLIEYGQQKPFLREVAHQVLAAMLPGLVGRSDASKLVQNIAKQVLAQGLVTPDALLWLLVLEQQAAAKGSNVSMKKIRALTPEWTTPYLHADNMPRIALLMRESSTADDAVSTDLYSVWHPQLHSVWSHLLPWLFAATPAWSSEEAQLFAARWRTLVDDGLFGEGTSHERKYWGFLLLQRAVCMLPASAFGDLFSKRLMHSLTTHLVSSNRYLHQCVLATVKAMVTASQQDSAKCPVILHALIERVSVSQMAATRVIDQLVRELDAESGLTYANYLFKRFAQPPMINDKMTEDDKEHVATQDRRWTLEQLALLAKNGKVRDDDTVMTLIEDMLMLHGYLEPQASADARLVERTGGALSTKLADEIRVICRQKLAKLFTGHLLTTSPSNAKRFQKLLEGDAYAFASDIDDDAERVVLINQIMKQMKKVEKQ
ncbi:hypothetical protein SYNPS1DRAFT_24245, partial [Syncephalis pseudoplumigaleata]